MKIRFFILLFPLLSMHFESSSQALLDDKDTTFIKIGGAVRFNTIYTIYEGETSPLPTENRNGFFWDTWRFEARGQTKNIGIDFEYRFYPGFNTHFVKKAFLYHDFSKKLQMQLGVTQVPFGALEFSGNSWWFHLPYYFGLEDDYDTGIKFKWQNENWTYHFAYFLMAEPRGVSEPGYGSFPSARYSYDVIPEDGYNGNKERNQLNARAEYEKGKFLMGFSAQFGEIYNSTTKKTFNHWATAFHSQYLLKEEAKIKFQFTHYDYPNSLDDAGNRVDHINMGAYGFNTYQVASSASTFSLGLSYEYKVDWGPISSLTFYDDYSYMHKYGSIEIMGTDYEFVDSHQNILGFMVTAGNTFTFFDIASGINQPWLSSAFGGNALSSGRGESVGEAVGVTEEGAINPPLSNPTINTRFNINIGYYF
ncbi:hypothetical protein QYS49_34060 [Marivirga salinae]|uniref:Porin n=1 Tax=Marivirga salinarum TaxID=3059078 RepID=A0AA51NCU6_9BACT|nr:hypothetical protein [Marivirga sp. BDSF4-3]WMN12609.1 hypothetical protein QYS49_34060 [Marivirga sp. BDSF4-3]